MSEFTDGDATRILQAIEERIRRRLKNGSLMSTTWGRVASVDADGANVYLYDELTAETVASEGFRIPNGYTVAADDMVKVWMDKSNGERWLDPSTCTLDVPDPLTIGTINVDSLVLDSATNFLRIQTDGTHALLIGPQGQTSNVPFRIGPDGDIEWGSGAGARDTNLYRGAANVLKTDDSLAVVGSAVFGDGTIISGQVRIDESLTSGLVILNDTTFLIRGFQSADTEARFRVQNTGLVSWGPGGVTAPDTNLYREGANLLATDDGFRIRNTGDLSLSSTTHGLTIGADNGANLAMDVNEIIARNNGATAELNLQTEGGRVGININAPGTTNADGIKFGSDTYLYRLTTNSLKTDGELVVAGDLEMASIFGSTVDSGSGSVTIAGDGTATFTTQTFSWYKYGRVVVAQCNVSVNAVGSGASTVTFTFSGMPAPAATGRVMIDRGGTGVNAIICRLVNSAGSAQFSDMKTASTFATVTGADLASGAGYQGTWAYLASA